MACYLQETIGGHKEMTSEMFTKKGRSFRSPLWKVHKQRVEPGPKFAMACYSQHGSKIH